MPLESTINPTSDGHYELRLNGQIHKPHWIVQLFSALSQSNVSIVSGEAAQDKPGHWRSRFVLDFSSSTADPRSLDYQAFAEKLPTGDRPPPPRLTKYDIRRRHDQLIELDVHGPDQMGFLASILSRVSVLALFPANLEIRTVSGRIHDTITLRGIGDRGPSEAAYTSLNTLIKSFVKA
jgi:hypothetical protein